MSEQVRNLGVTFDTELAYKAHINKICQVSFLHVRLLRRIRDHLDISSCKLLANALVTSRLDYCNSLLVDLPQKSLKKLQSVQNAIARVVMPNTKKWDHITPILKKLHWLPVKHRITFKVAVMTFKALNGRAPRYLSDLICRLPQSSRRSSSKNLLLVPFVKSACGRRCFSFAAPSVWNSLPDSVRLCSDEFSFRKQLKTHLFKIS